MKKIPLFTILVACAFLLLAIFPKHSGTFAMSKAPQKESAFKDSDGWNKADLRLRQAWLESGEKGNRDRQLECILKTKERMSAEQKKEITEAGFKYRTLIGKIVTGSMKAKDLPAVANLEFVQAMELAIPMSLKNK